MCHSIPWVFVARSGTRKGQAKASTFETVCSWFDAANYKREHASHPVARWAHRKQNSSHKTLAENTAFTAQPRQNDENAFWKQQGTSLPLVTFRWLMLSFTCDGGDCRRSNSSFCNSRQRFFRWFLFAETSQVSRIQSTGFHSWLWGHTAQLIACHQDKWFQLCFQFMFTRSALAQWNQGSYVGPRDLEGPLPSNFAWVTELLPLLHSLRPLDVVPKMSINQDSD